MKKIAVLLAMLFVLPLSACETKDAIIGTWRLVQVDSGASIVRYEDSDETTMFYAREDGTLTMYQGEIIQDGTWSVTDETYALSIDQAYTATMDQGTLYLKIPGYTMTYQRVSDTYTEIERPVYVLEGSWTFTSIVSGDTTVDYTEMATYLEVDFADMTTTLVLQEDGTALMASVNEVKEGAWSGTPEEATITFDGNAAAAIISQGDLYIASAQQEGVMAVYDRLSDAQTLANLSSDLSLAGEWRTFATVNNGEITIIDDVADTYGTTAVALAGKLSLEEDGSGAYIAGSATMPMTWEWGERYFSMTMDGTACKGIISKDKLMIFMGESAIYVFEKAAE